VRELRAALPREVIITTDGTATEFWLSEPSFPILSPAGFIVPEVQQTMGYSMAAAVGAAVALSDASSSRPIVCVTGDGSLQMHLGELATAASLGRQLTVVIFDDGYYNALRIYQDGLYGRQVGVALRNPDFMLLGRAYGADVERVEDIGSLRRAVEHALATSKLSVISVAIDPAPLPDRYARRLQQMV
jgi:acetolactate synthase-1/2/3 large subunit